MNQVLPQDSADLIRGIIEAAEEVLDPLEALVEATKQNPGAPLAPEALEQLAQLKAEDPAAFETIRAQLKAAGCRVGALDEALAQKSDAGDNTRSPSQADRLIQIATAADLFHTSDGTTYVDITVDGHRETWPVRAKGFRGWLTKRYYEETGGAPNNEALQSALRVLDAKARFDGPERPVFVRVGEHEGKIYLDLVDAAWLAVEIDAQGWRVVDTPPVRFRRALGMKPLPLPTRGGSIHRLRRFLNVQSEADFVLVVAWALGCLRPKGPYPLLVLSGEQGSAKSTFSAIVRALIDPNSAPLRALPREDRDLFIAATNAHVLAFDNLSGLSPWISDTLCRLATGGGFSVRALFTDQDEVIFEAMRPVILNGIEDVVTRADLADRAIVLQLAPIPEERRRPEAEIWAEFEAERPQLLGALLDGVVEGLRNLPSMRLPRLPRMADFAKWVSAYETAYWPEGTFWAAYEGNRQEAVESVIEADPVAMAVRALMAERSEWVGTATDLLAALTRGTDERTAKAKFWPDGARALSGRLKRSATFLRKVGIEIDHLKGKGKSPARLIRLSAPQASARTDSGEQRSSEPSEPSEPSTKLNGFNGFEALPRRTVGTASDANADDRRDPVLPTVRRKSLETQAADEADDADANLPILSEQEEETAAGGWRGKL